MKSKITKSLIFALLLSASAANLPAPGCSFENETYFTYTSHPDLPLNKYAAGQLGIIENGYARSYLLTAYRYLEGRALSESEQKAVLQLWNDRLKIDYESSFADPSVWLKSRSTVPGAARIAQIDVDRPISKEEPWQTYCNCQTNAFQSASDTLKSLIARYGANSQNVKDWLKAQDQVFSNCSYPSWSEAPPPQAIPAALPGTADELLRKYRNYQIAAANFYSQNFDKAIEQFEAIASDSASPLNHIAPYMAIRCMLRKYSLSKTPDKTLLTAAQTSLKKLQDNPSYKDLSGDMDKLLSFIDARLDPAGHVEKLISQPYSGGRLGELTKTLDSILGDCDQDLPSDKKPAGLPESLKNIDALDWLVSFKSGAGKSKEHALERWEKNHSTAWLLSAISSLQSGDPLAKELLGAAEQKLNSPSAACYSLLYQANRLRLGIGETEKVRKTLDALINAPPADLPQGALNKFKTQRLPLSKSLDEFVKFGFQPPLSNCLNGGVSEVPEDINDIIKGKITKTKAVFTPEAGSVMQRKMPLSSLINLARSPGLPSEQRNNIAWTAWVRAVLVGDENAAKELARAAALLNKQKASMFQSYLSAGKADERAFAAAFLMLHFSSAQPNPSWGQLPADSYGDSSGWWWSDHPVTESSSADTDEENKSKSDFDPLFLSGAEKNQAGQQLAKLDKVAAAPNYFAAIVIPFARTHPNDPRVPEALHYFVKATRYGAADDSTRTFSKQAFNILHGKYKTSPWTRKTPYFY